MSVEGDNFVAQNLTKKNSAGQVVQAVVLALNANKVLSSNCNLLGKQNIL
jgi:pectin methylesterase-like acyl-CoA thioesterase